MPPGQRAHSISAGVGALPVIQTGLSGSFCIEVQYISLALLFFSEPDVEVGVEIADGRTRTPRETSTPSAACTPAAWRAAPATPPRASHHGWPSAPRCR